MAAVFVKRWMLKRSTGSSYSSHPTAARHSTRIPTVKHFQLVHQTDLVLIDPFHHQLHLPQFPLKLSLRLLRRRLVESTRMRETQSTTLDTTSSKVRHPHSQVSPQKAHLPAWPSCSSSLRFKSRISLSKASFSFVIAFNFCKKNKFVS